MYIIVCQQKRRTVERILSEQVYYRIGLVPLSNSIPTSYFGVQVTLLEEQKFFYVTYN